MNDKWRIYEIAELCEDIVDCLNRTAPKVDYTTPYKMIRTSNVRNGRIDLEKVFYVDEPTFNKWTRRKVPQKDDVILTREAPLGEIGILRTDDKVFLGQRIVMYRSNEKICNAKFLYYALLSPFCQTNIKSFGMGATVEHMKVPDSKKIKVRVPPLPIQKKIARILSAYDDLIENNLKRIKLLEEAAQNIYEEWFVRMCFPGHETTPINKETGLPEGWERKKIGEVLVLNYGKALKQDIRIKGNIPVFGSSGIVGYHNKPLVKGPGIVLGRKGNVGSVFWSEYDYYPIDTVYFVSTEQSLFFIYFMLKYQNFINNDAAVPGLNRNAAYLKYFIQPNVKTMIQFENQVKTIFAYLKCLKYQNHQLKEARDILLPRLMSGILDVEKINVK